MILAHLYKHVQLMLHIRKRFDIISTEEARRLQTIRDLREERGWTQLRLANELGVTPVTIYNWERGRYEPKVSQFRALAKAFGVSMDEIALVNRESGVPPETTKRPRKRHARGSTGQGSTVCKEQV